MVALHDAKILVTSAAIAFMSIVFEVPLVVLQLGILSAIAIQTGIHTRSRTMEGFETPTATSPPPVQPAQTVEPVQPDPIPTKNLLEFVEVRDTDPPELTHFRTTHGRFTLTADPNISSSHKWSGPSSSQFIGGDISTFVTVEDALPDYEVGLIEFTGTDSEGDTVRLSMTVTGGVAPEVSVTLGADTRVSVPVTTHMSVRTFYMKYSKTALVVGFFDHYVYKSQGVVEQSHGVRVLNGNEFPITMNKTMVKLHIKSVAIYSGVIGDQEELSVREALRKLTFLKVEAYKKLHESYDELKMDLDERKTLAPFSGVDADCNTVDWSRYDPSSATPQCRSAILRSCQTDPTQPLCGCWNTQSSEYNTLQCMAYRMFYGSEEPLVVKEPDPEPDPDAGADGVDNVDGIISNPVSIPYDPTPFIEPAGDGSGTGTGDDIVVVPTKSSIRHEKYVPPLTWYAYLTDDLPL